MIIKLIYYQLYYLRNLFAFVKSVVLRLIERINVTAETKFTPGYYEEIWKAVKQNEFPTYYILVCCSFTLTDTDDK